MACAGRLGWIVAAVCAAGTLSAASAQAAEQSCAELAEKLERATYDLDDRRFIKRDMRWRDDFYSSEMSYQIDLAAPRYAIAAGSEAQACWRARAGRQVDRRTREAVYAASSQILFVAGVKAKREGEQGLSLWDVREAFKLERATDVPGPATKALARNGQALFAPHDGLGGRESRPGKAALDRGAMEDTVMELAMLCVAEPRAFREAALELGYPADLLQARPSRQMKADLPRYADTDDWEAYVDAQMARITEDCRA